jgi:hypothetical protein
MKERGGNNKMITLVRWTYCLYTNKENVKAGNFLQERAKYPLSQYLTQHLGVDFNFLHNEVGQFK